MEHTIIFSYSGEYSEEFLKLSAFLEWVGYFVYEIRSDAGVYPQFPEEMKNAPILMFGGKEAYDPGALAATNQKNKSLYLKKDAEAYCVLDDGRDDRSGGLSLADLPGRIVQWLQRPDLRKAAAEYEEFGLFEPIYAAKLLNWTVPGKQVVQDNLQIIQAYLREKNCESAVEYYQKASLTAAANSLSKSIQAGSLYSFEELYDCLDHCLKVDPDMWRALDLLGDSYSYFKKDKLKANIYYSTAAAHGDYRAAFKKSGFWREVNVSLENEKKCIGASLQINPFDLESMYYLASALEVEGSFGEALEWYNKIVEILREREKGACLQINEFKYLASAHKQIGCILYKHRQNYEEAVSHYYKVFELYNTVESNLLLQELYAGKNRNDYVQAYRNSINIFKVVGSIVNIFELMGDMRRREAYDKLWRLSERLDEVPIL